MSFGFAILAIALLGYGPPTSTEQAEPERPAAAAPVEEITSPASEPTAADRNIETEALRAEVEQLRTRLDELEAREQQRNEQQAELRRHDANRDTQRHRYQQAQLDRYQQRNNERQRLLTRRIKALERVRFGADFRFRVEHDWNSRNDDGSYRDDRFRMRYRARLGVEVDASRHVSFGVRTRTGVPTNMQSPHVNVGYNGFGLAPFNLARAYVRGDYRYVWWWLGKNGLPLWRSNELFWDDDVNPEGVAMGGVIPLHPKVELRPTAAYFVADHEQIVAYPDSRIVAAQLHFSMDMSDMVHVDAASSYLHMQKIFDVPQHLSRDLWDQGGQVGVRRDHQFIYSGVQAQVATQIADYAFPFSLGFDHSVNVHNNRGSDLVPDHYEDQKHMYVAHARVGHATRIGGSSRLGDWYVGYTFAWKERDSVISYYGEDDWVRWGNIHRNRNTNYAGHEVRAAVSLGPRIDLLWRLYIVEALVVRLEQNGTALESGSRTRLDLNVRF